MNNLDLELYVSVKEYIDKVTEESFIKPRIEVTDYYKLVIWVGCENGDKSLTFSLSSDHIEVLRKNILDGTTYEWIVLDKIEDFESRWNWLYYE